MYAWPGSGSSIMAMKGKTSSATRWSTLPALLLVFLLTSEAYGQELSSVQLSVAHTNLYIKSFNKEPALPEPLPLFTLRVNGQLLSTRDTKTSGNQTILADQLKLEWSFPPYEPGIKGSITFKNITADTLVLENIVPLGADPAHVYITGLGDHPLSRAYLFRPGYEPLNVILPDNAWELGFSAIDSKGMQLAALARRDPSSITNGLRKRFATILYPGGSVSYLIWMDRCTGSWQDALELMFRRRMLYDVDPGTFDNSLYERADLQWIRHACVSHLLMAWDDYYYDYTTGNFNLETFMQRGRQLYGGDDFIGIWPTWPTLGIDRRNQWDLFRDLPGGLPGLKQQAEMLGQNGSSLFICYNPWDEDTRSEQALSGMTDLIAGTGASGVVLDTRGESSRELQEAADAVKPGVVMYSEGMAVPKHMQGIVAGRVHNALYYCPELNLNKLIKPEFAIFRVAELYKEPIKREFCLAFFNGYGTELNIFAPGKPDWLTEQYRFLGHTSMILRENTDVFTGGRVKPLLATTRDRIWVNTWVSGDKTLYTIYSTIPLGFKGLLFDVEPAEGFHFVDLWHHKLLEPKKAGERWLIEAETFAFNASWLGTNNEGEIDCIARLPILLEAKREGDRLLVKQNGDDEIHIWAGSPDYAKTPFKSREKELSLSLLETFGRYEGSFIIQLFKNDLLQDETIVELRPGTPRLVTSPEKTIIHNEAPAGMVPVPSGSFTYHGSNGDEFIPYPHESEGRAFAMPAFYMDRYPVTNAQFRDFLRATGYTPDDTASFLAHWKKGDIPAGQEDYPVVYVSWEDAAAYASWAGKRLPTELEWQYAAQTPDMNEWPWKQNSAISQSEENITETLSIQTIEGLNKSLCNTGNGQPGPVGAYPEGANPYGLQDLVGCVWQLTNDLYVSGSYRYIMMKGGSWYKPTGSWWYVQGGPRPLHYRQYLLRVSPGFERNETVGFRCVAD